MTRVYYLSIRQEHIESITLTNWVCNFLFSNNNRFQFIVTRVTLTHEVRGKFLQGTKNTGQRMTEVNKTIYNTGCFYTYGSMNFTRSQTSYLLSFKTCHSLLLRALVDCTPWHFFLSHCLISHHVDLFDCLTYSFLFFCACYIKHWCLLEKCRTYWWLLLVFTFFIKIKNKKKMVP